MGFALLEPAPSSGSLLPDTPLVGAADIGSSYAATVLADRPAAYYRLDEPTGATAFDSSGNGRDATYLQSPQLGASGALVGDPDAGIVANAHGLLLSQSGDRLPDGNRPRTLEAWVRYATYDNGNNLAYQNFDVFRYGDVAGGHGFTVTVLQSGSGIRVSGATGSVSAPTLPGFTSGWHLLDITYDGATADIYQDGQLIGSERLGEADTLLPGEGLQMNADNPTYGLDEAAIYPTALSPERIDAHWTTGAKPAAASACADAPAAPYAATVLADSPSAYYRFDELADHPADRVAFDSSGHCVNATYVGASTLAGAVSGDDDGAATANAHGVLVSQSGAGLPAGDSPRTLEAWVKYATYDNGNNLAYQNFDVFRYGDVADGHGFTVTILQSGSGVLVSGATTAVAVDTLRGFMSGWHLLDVTYDGDGVQVYEDGQAIGGGQLGHADTVLPGQGLRMDADNPTYGLDEAAVYTTALSPERIDAHWTAGAKPVGAGACADAPTAPYAATVLADAPSAYYRLDDVAAHPQDRVAFDASGHCANATLLGPSPGIGALVGDDDPSVTANAHGILLSQSGDRLPDGNRPRTLEAWVRYATYDNGNNLAYQSFDVFRYGDVAGGHGFTVTVLQSGDGSSATPEPCCPGRACG